MLLRCAKQNNNYPPSVEERNKSCFDVEWTKKRKWDLRRTGEGKKKKKKITFFPGEDTERYSRGTLCPPPLHYLTWNETSILLPTTTVLVLLPYNYYIFVQRGLYERVRLLPLLSWWMYDSQTWTEWWFILFIYFFFFKYLRKLKSFFFLSIVAWKLQRFKQIIRMGKKWSLTVWERLVYS